MPSVRLVFLAALLVVQMTALASSARTTRWPKPQTPRRAGGGGSSRIPTTSPSPSSSLPMDETTEVTMDALSTSPTVSTTYSSDSYSTEFHTDALAPPGNTLANFTLNFSECFFNICECCPPEKVPAGPMGESGPPGPQGERGPLGKMVYHFQSNYLLEVNICSSSYSSLFLFRDTRRGRTRAQRTSRTSRTTWLQRTQWRHRYGAAGEFLIASLRFSLFSCNTPPCVSIWLDANFYTLFLKSTTGDKGAQGPVGLPGAPGVPGKPGDKGVYCS